ncbi:hypothetical protein [Nocardia nova]|uniref:hypothetical protein n=1 Tax=Nocardia nova TaxID=37330 RepID=UPI002738C0C9|nr:hypothetical protein [Nocardia nova]
MPELSAADIAEGHRQYVAFFDGSEPVEYLLGWVASHLPALLDAAEKVARIREALSNHPRCDKHPEDGVITCGWQRAVAGVQWALDTEESSDVQ